MKSLLKVLVSVVALAFIATRLDWPAVLESLARLAWWTLPTAVALQACAFGVGATRWHSLLSTHQAEIRVKDLLRPYFIGAFFNNFLPSSTGGDAYRIYHVHRSKQGAAAAFAPVLAERLLGLMTLLLITVIAYALRPVDDVVIVRVVTVAAVLLLVLACGMACLGLRFLYQPIHALLTRFEDRKFARDIRLVTEAARQYIRQPMLVAKVIAISGLMHAFVTTVFVVLGSGVQAELPVISYALIVPPILVSAGLPLTIGGLGIREGAGIVLFSSAGLLTADAAAVSLLFIPTLLLASSPGLFFFLLGRHASGAAISAKDASAEETSRP